MKGLLTVVALSISTSAVAQAPENAHPGEGFATIGIVGTAHDPADGAEHGLGVTRGHLLLNATVFVAPRIGAGIEVFPAHDADVTLSNNLSFTDSERLHEKAIVSGTVRGRVLAQPKREAFQFRVR